MDNIKIRTCPVCKQEVKIKPGMHNWKNLFRMPTIEDMIVLFIILAVISLYFVYQHDIKQYQNYIEKNCQGFNKVYNEKLGDINIESFNNINERE